MGVKERWGQNRGGSDGGAGGDGEKNCKRPYNDV